MDITSFFLPGAQSLVTSILADGWSTARSALAHRWAKRGKTSQEAAENELEKGHELAQHIASGDDGERQKLLEVYWAGYLAGLATSHADLIDAVRELGAAHEPTAQGATVHNSNTGTVGTLLQAGDVHGNISFGR